MSTEVLINITPSETRVARVDNGVLQEINIERAQKRGLVGNIYKGKVVRVLPGMQAAFIDIGRDKAGFIHINDLRPRGDETVDRWASGERDIRELLREGDMLAVQVLKDPIGTKGPRLTTFLSVSSRYLVFMPKTDHIGVSQRIEDETERERLRTELFQRMRAFLEKRTAQLIEVATENAIPVPPGSTTSFRYFAAQATVSATSSSVTEKPHFTWRMRIGKGIAPGDAEAVSRLEVAGAVASEVPR